MIHHGKKNRTKHEESELNMYTAEKLLSFPIKVNNNNNNILTKNYELFNIVSENGDSIYAPQYEEFKTLGDDIEGQVFVSEITVQEIVNRIIDHHHHHKRLGPSINNNLDENE